MPWGLLHHLLSFVACCRYPCAEATYKLLRSNIFSWERKLLLIDFTQVNVFVSWNMLHYHNVLSVTSYKYKTDGTINIKPIVQSNAVFFKLGNFKLCEFQLHKFPNQQRCKGWKRLIKFHQSSCYMNSLLFIWTNWSFNSFNKQNCNIISFSCHHKPQPRKSYWWFAMEKE